MKVKGNEEAENGQPKKNQLTARKFTVYNYTSVICYWQLIVFQFYLSHNTGAQLDIYDFEKRILRLKSFLMMSSIEFGNSPVGGVFGAIGCSHLKTEPERSLYWEKTKNEVNDRISILQAWIP